MPVIHGQESRATRIIEKEMGITHRDFFRLLPFALGTDQFLTNDNTAHLQSGNRSVGIELGPEGKRQIALLVIPTTHVKITLEGYSESESEEFLTVFDRAYQRGGG